VVDQFGPFDFVKLDCEGAEYDIVMASSPRSWATVTKVVLEYHPSPTHSWPELKMHFDELGFSVVAQQSVSDAQGTAWLQRSSAAEN
jgi:hypothetical protein